MDHTLVQVVRNGRIESLHAGFIAVVDREGNPQAAFGNINYATYLRSAAKPFQAYPLISNNGDEHFSFSSAELALMSASHTAEPRHIELVESIFDKIGYSRDLLQCGPHPPIYPREAERLYRENIPFEAIHNNCSGKHAGMLAQCRLCGSDASTYLSLVNPVQQNILASVSRFSGIPSKEIPTGIDGCSAPTFYMPLINLAAMFARLAQGADRPSAVIRNAMTANPFLVGGTERFDTLFMEATKGRFVSKTGAEGVQCIGIVDGGARPECSGWGLALKILDGSVRAKSSAALEALHQLNILTGEDIRNLRDCYSPKILNHAAIHVGSIVPSFTLDI